MADDEFREVDDRDDPDDDRDDPDDDWDDPDDNWPARRVEQLSGDAFGNNAEYLWRCELCGGYFVKHDPDDWGSVTVGLIAYEVSLEEQMKEREERWARANRALAEKICTCDFHRHSIIGFSFPR